MAGSLIDSTDDDRLGFVDDLVTEDVVEEVYHLSRRALQLQRARGAAPGALGVRVGGSYLYPLGDLRAWWEETLRLRTEALRERRRRRAEP